MTGGFNKIGFHAGSGSGNSGIIENYVRPLNENGLPAVVKSVNNVGLAVEVAQIGLDNGVENQVILRFAGDPRDDNPTFRTRPEAAAESFWGRLKRRLENSPELLPFREHIWIEMLNEPDKMRWSSHVGPWASYLAQAANEDGWKVALLGVSAGEPEPEQWQASAFSSFLAFASERPESVAITVHEGKAPLPVDTTVPALIPHLVGRVKYLFKACDQLELDHPTVFVSQWAWAFNDMPDTVEAAMSDVSKLAAHYAAFPTVKGVYLWTLNAGRAWANLPNRLNRLLTPMADFSIALASQTTARTAPPILVTRGDPRVQYARTFNVIPPDATEEQAVAIFLEAWHRGREAVGSSYDDAGIGNLETRVANLYGLAPDKQEELRAWYARHYPGVKVQFFDIPGAVPAESDLEEPATEPELPPTPSTSFMATAWPTDFRHITQYFGSNPQIYNRFGLPGHEGIDFRAPHGSPVYAIADGLVSRVGDDRVAKKDGGHNYGIRVYIDHADGYQSIYAHLNIRHVDVGSQVTAGQRIGDADNTGNSFGDHLHLTLKKLAHDYVDELGDWPYNICDPTPFFRHLAPELFDG